MQVGEEAKPPTVKKAKPTQPDLFS